jgi:hypothetical protein
VPSLDDPFKAGTLARGLHHFLKMASVAKISVFALLFSVLMSTGLHALPRNFPTDELQIRGMERIEIENMLRAISLHDLIRAPREILIALLTRVNLREFTRAGFNFYHPVLYGEDNFLWLSVLIEADLIKTADNFRRIPSKVLNKKARVEAELRELASTLTAIIDRSELRNPFLFFEISAAYNLSFDTARNLPHPNIQELLLNVMSLYFTIISDNEHPIWNGPPSINLAAHELAILAFKRDWQMVLPKVKDHSRKSVQDLIQSFSPRIEEALVRIQTLIVRHTQYLKRHAPIEKTQSKSVHVLVTESENIWAKEDHESTAIYVPKQIYKKMEEDERTDWEKIKTYLPPGVWLKYPEIDEIQSLITDLTKVPKKLSGAQFSTAPGHLGVAIPQQDCISFIAALKAKKP